MTCKGGPSSCTRLHCQFEEHEFDIYNAFDKKSPRNARFFCRLVLRSCKKHATTFTFVMYKVDEISVSHTVLRRYWFFKVQTDYATNTINWWVHAVVFLSACFSSALPSHTWHTSIVACLTAKYRSKTRVPSFQSCRRRDCQSVDGSTWAFPHAHRPHISFCFFINCGHNCVNISSLSFMFCVSRKSTLLHIATSKTHLLLVSENSARRLFLYLSPYTLSSSLP